MQGLSWVPAIGQSTRPTGPCPPGRSILDRWTVANRPDTGDVRRGSWGGRHGGEGCPQRVKRQGAGSWRKTGENKEKEFEAGKRVTQEVGLEKGTRWPLSSGARSLDFTASPFGRHWRVSSRKVASAGFQVTRSFWLPGGG